MNFLKNSRASLAFAALLFFGFSACRAWDPAKTKIYSVRGGLFPDGSRETINFDTWGSIEMYSTATVIGKSANAYAFGVVAPNSWYPQSGHELDYQLVVTTEGYVGIGTANPTARLHLGAGAAAPLKFASGTLLATPQAGAVEFDGTHFYVTIGSTRYQLATNYSKSFVITNPTASADKPLWRVPSDITITAVHVLCIGGTNIVGQLWEYDSNGANGSAVDSSDITGTAGSNVNDDGSLSNAAISAGNYLGWQTTSVSGTVTSAVITFDYGVN